MAHVLKIVHGATTLTLTSGAYALMDYTPTSPENDITEFARGAFKDGGEISGSRYRNVTESVQVRVTAANQATMIAAVRAIETVFRLCAEYANTRRGSRTYLHFQPTGGTEYRSEILSGRAMYDNNALLIWRNSVVTITLEWTRRFYFENTTGVGLQVSNAFGIATAPAVLAVVNRTVTGTSNYVDIAAAQVPLGDMPAATIIEMRVSGTLSIRNVFMFVNAWNDPFDIPHFFEAEDATILSSGALQANSANASGPGQNWVKWTGAGALDTTNTPILRFLLNAATLEHYKGDIFNAILRLHETPVLTYNPTLQIKLTVGATYFPVWESEPVRLLGGELVNMGNLPIPPIPPGLTDFRDSYVEVWGRTSDQTADISIDFLHLAPAANSRQLRAIDGTEVVSAEGIWDDGAGDRLYIKESVSGNTYQSFYGIGDPIMLTPGVDHRIYFLSDRSDGSFPIGGGFSVAVSYQPRWLSV